MNTIVCRWLAASALAVLLSSAAWADPQEKHGYSQNHQGDEDNDKRHDWDDRNHGEIVSACNHRANDRHMNGKDRQEFIEWCTEHGPRYKYDDRYYHEDRACYRKADEKNLSGDKRRHFINECIRKHEVKRGEAGVGSYGEPRGKDVLGKGNTK